MQWRACLHSFFWRPWLAVCSYGSFPCSFCVMSEVPVSTVPGSDNRVQRLPPVIPITHRVSFDDACQRAT